VTSAAPTDGKTTVAANLAIVFAQTGDRILIIDADLRRPKIHSMFGLRKSPGLTDCLVGKSSPKDVIHRDTHENLDVLCCGMAAPNPAEILGSRKMKEFLEQLKGQYDYILFDSAPVLAVTDSPVLATIVDGTILVVSANSTNIHALDRSIEQINFVGARLLGVLLNNLDLVKAYGAYSRSDQYGYYAKEYSHYHGTKSQSKKNYSTPEDRRK
jgi:tyrosine-protein kinase Etk/Wzc